jgi:1-acyl-sn-glycerol-3-phosphate acyltransferase
MSTESNKSRPRRSSSVGTAEEVTNVWRDAAVFLSLYPYMDEYVLRTKFSSPDSSCDDNDNDDDDDDNDDMIESEFYAHTWQHEDWLKCAKRLKTVISCHLQSGSAMPSSDQKTSSSSSSSSSSSESDVDTDSTFRELYAAVEMYRMDYCELKDVSIILRSQELRARRLKAKSKSTSATAAATVAHRTHTDTDTDTDTETDAMHQHANEDVMNLMAEISHKRENQVHEIMGHFDQCRELLAIQTPPVSKMYMVLRFLMACTFALLWLPILFILLPLRPLHPLFRKCGIPNNFLPLDRATKWFARGLLQLLSIDLHAEGIEHIDNRHNTLGMFTHASNLDPFICSSSSLAFKFVGKRSLFYIPLFGWLMYLYGHIGIDRSNKSAAISSLADAVSRIHRWKRSICISPEGTRSRTGRLLDFKKGPFHTAIAVNIPITPMVILGAYNVWPRSHLFAIPGTVTLRYLPRIIPRKNEDHVALSNRLRRHMLLGAMAKCDPHTRSLWSTTGAFFGRIFMPLCYVLLASVSYYR